MKRFLMLLSLFMLLGCSNKDDILNSKYKLSANYNELHNSHSAMKTMIQTEENLLFYPKIDYKQNSYNLAMYLDADDKIAALQNDASKICTKNDLQNCSYIDIDVPYYYKGYLYSLKTEYNTNTNDYNTYIERCELDGTKSKKVYEFEKDTKGNHMMTSSFIQFHNNRIYILYNDQIYYGNIDNLKLKQWKQEGLKGINSIFMYDEKMYLLADSFDNGKKLDFDVVLECDLDGNNKEVIYKNALVYFIDENVLFYLNSDEWNTYYYNFATKESKMILEGPCPYFLKQEDRYVLDSIMINDAPKILVVNKDGVILGSRELKEDENHYPQIFIDNKLYVDMVDGYGYYEITEDGISDLKILEYAD